MHLIWGSDIISCWLLLQSESGALDNSHPPRTPCLWLRGDVPSLVSIWRCLGRFLRVLWEKGWVKIKAQHVVNGSAVAPFNYNRRIFWAVSDPTSIARTEDFSFVFVTFWPSSVWNSQEMRWSDVNYPRRLYATVKLDFIILTTRSGGSVPVNKQGAACYIVKGADLRPFVCFTCLSLCMMAQFTRHGWGEALRASIQRWNSTGMTHDQTRSQFPGIRVL